MVLICAAVVGCGSRALTDKEVAGIYKASTDWGYSTLVLHPDHSFDQTVMRNDHTQLTSKGTWKLTLIAGMQASSGIIELQKFIAVDHSHKGDVPGWGAPGTSRGPLGGVTIAVDPDYGISFDKK
jgi:hypothetical protein